MNMSYGTCTISSRDHTPLEVHLVALERGVYDSTRQSIPSVIITTVSLILELSSSVLDIFIQ